MARSFVYGTVKDTPRRVIYAVRVQDARLDPAEIDVLAGRMREKLEARGELACDVVVIQGDTKESLRLFGLPYAVNRVRVAMFNASIRWSPLDFD
jgi:hypothetical protein